MLGTCPEAMDRARRRSTAQPARHVVRIQWQCAARPECSTSVAGDRAHFCAQLRVSGCRIVVSAHTGQH